MFKRYCQIISLVLISGLLLSSCDEGDIPEKEYKRETTGRTVKLTGTFTGLDDWTRDYSVSLAAYDGESEYSLVQKALPVSAKDGSPLTVILNNVSEDAVTVELSVNNNLRQRILTIESVKTSDFAAGDTIRMDVGTLDVSMFGTMQHHVFNNACIQCHGGNGFTAAGLNLTEGNSYSNLVGVASARVEGAQRVDPGHTENSVLHMIMQEGNENLLKANHVEIFSSQFKSELENLKIMIDKWINERAE